MTSGTNLQVDIVRLSRGLCRRCLVKRSHHCRHLAGAAQVDEDGKIEGWREKSVCVSVRVDKGRLTLLQGDKGDNGRHSLLK